jgi:hypothetical protein
MSEMVTTPIDTNAIINALNKVVDTSTDFYKKVREAGFNNIVEGYTSNFRDEAWFRHMAERCAYYGNIGQHTAVLISNEREAELTNSLVPTSTIEAGVRHVVSDLDVETDNIHSNLQGSSQWVPNDGVSVPNPKTVSLKPFFSMKQGDYERFIALVTEYHTTHSTESVEALSSFDKFDGLVFYNSVMECVTAHNEQMTKSGRKFLVLCNAAGKGLNPSVGACIGPIQVSDITPKGWGAAAFHFLVCTVAEPMGISVINLARGEGEELFPLPSMPPQAPQFIAEYPDADAFVDRGGGRLALVYKDGRSGFRSASYMEASGVIETMMKIDPEKTRKVCEEFVATM